MSSAIDKLIQLADAPDRFDFSYDELRETQIAAVDERFQDRRDRIKLLARRADEAGVTEIRSREDIVPVLFPHTAYKSYPESFLVEQRWDRLAKWLSSVTPYPVGPIDTAGVDGIDDWIARLQEAGHYVTCSSGTTGTPAMLPSSRKDIDWSCDDAVNVFSWGSGVEPAQDRRMFGLGLTASAAKNIAIGRALFTAFMDPAKEPFGLPIPPITVGSLTSMVVLRKKVADGTARPDEVAEYEKTSRERQEAVDAAMIAGAEALIAHRADKLYISGMWGPLYELAKLVRDRGYAAKDFHPDNCIYVGGGLKRAQLPDDYQEFVHQTFNIPADRDFQMYGMQEIGSGMPKCRKGNRYHVPPWVVPLVLDESGDTLLTHESGEIEGRAAFFDLSLDGRWGGVISGDKIALTLDPCACGSKSPSIRNTITRYADLTGDDKIACSGTVDAYVRGLS